MKVNLKLLIKKCDYNPTRIGIAILKSQGCGVHTYAFNNSVYVRNKKGKLVYYRDDD